MQANIKVTKVLEFYDQATHNKQYNKNDMTTGKSYFLYEFYKARLLGFKRWPLKSN